MADIAKGDQVSWPWGEGRGEGWVTQLFHEDVTLTLKGTEVTRRADESCPAVLIEQDDGAEVLKSASELTVEKRRDS